MTYVFHTDTDPAKMDEFVIHSDQNSLFQCSPWAQIKNNWKSVFASVEENGEIKASALVLFRNLAAGMTLAYIPRGPVMDYRDTKLAVFMLDNLKELAREHHAIAIRFDPATASRKPRSSGKP